MLRGINDEVGSGVLSGHARLMTNASSSCHLQQGGIIVGSTIFKRHVRDVLGSGI